MKIHNNYKFYTVSRTFPHRYKSTFNVFHFPYNINFEFLEDRFTYFVYRFPFVYIFVCIWRIVNICHSYWHRIRESCFVFVLCLFPLFSQSPILKLIPMFFNSMFKCHSCENLNTICINFNWHNICIYIVHNKTLLLYDI